MNTVATNVAKVGLQVVALQTRGKTQPNMKYSMIYKGKETLDLF